MSNYQSFSNDVFSKSASEEVGEAYISSFEVLEEHNLVISILSSSYTLAYIQESLHFLLQIASNSFTFSSSLSIVKRFGRIVEKLKIYPNDFYLPNLKHLYGTFLYCQKLMLLGYNIHLIESIDSTGLKKMGDIDIFASKNGELLLVDYSQYKNLDNDNIDNESKLFVLSQKFQNVSYKFSVVSCRLPVQFKESKLLLDVDHDTNFSTEFQNIDSLLDCAMGLSSTQCQDLIDDYIKKITNLRVDQSCVRLTSRGTGKFTHFNLLTKMIAENGVQSALTFTKMLMPHLNDVKSVHDYNLDLFSIWEKCDENPIFNFELSSRHVGIQNNDPFDRLGLIIDANNKLGVQNHPLILLIHMSRDGEEHPTSGEENYANNHPLWHMFGDIRCKRLRHKKTNELMDAVSLTFNSSHYNSLESISFGNKHTREEIKSMRKSSKQSDYVTLEKDLEKFQTWALSEGNGSRYYEEISDLVDCVMPDSQVASVIRKMMNLTLNSLKRTQLGALLSQVQEVALTMCNSPRKKRNLKSKHHGFKKTTCDLSLDCVSDRFLVTLTNMSSTLNSHKDQTVCVAGVFPFEDSNLSRSCKYGMSEWFGMSAADLDWHSTLVHKLISWLGLEIEELIVNVKDPKPEEIIRIMLTPSLIMMINDKKFAQASEMVRYIFVNSTGIAGGTRDLYTKVDWFKPSNMISKLYLLRMMKMSTGLQFMKAHGERKQLQNLYSDNIQGPGFNKTFRFSHWNIAFPHEYKYVPSDLHVYNSFYICKAFTIERHNKLQSEALVLLKQLEARKDYLKVLAKNNCHEAKHLDLFMDEDHLMSYCFNRQYADMSTEAYSPDPIVVMLGAFASLLKTFPRFNSVREIVDKNFPSRELPRLLKLTDIMNNHGSVANKGTHGLISTNSKTIELETAQRRQKRVKITTQNDKAYHTLLRDVHDFVTDQPIKKFVQDWNAVPTEYDDNLDIPDHDVLQSSIRCNNLIWPLMLRHVTYGSQFVSKMTHKDQIGEREIATLNAPSRICCYFVEEFARMIRTQEHKLGNTVNLIERSDKELLVKTAYSKSRLSHNEGKTVIYDSADCSKWGPSMLTYILYLSIGLRVSDKSVRTMIKLCLKLFSNKVFKIPDYFFLTMNLSELNELETNAVNKARGELKRMDVSFLGNVEKQIIYLPESMHQGILGASSSVLGADLLHLSNKCISQIVPRVNVTSFCTSDDYTRILTVDHSQDDTSSIMDTIKHSLSLHIKISNDFGIKRNMQKSTHNIHVMEFNSVFYSTNSENKPDIKSRLSYVDFPHSYDPYPGALETLNKGLEFLRMEGSLYGACWVQTLNSHLCLLQNQGLPLFKILKRNIFKVPLELGGLVSIDPIMAVQSSQFLPMIENYCPVEDWVAQAGMSVMMDMKPNEVELVSLDPEDEMKSLVPRMSRSGTINLCRRDKQTSRKVREFLNDIPRQYFIDLRFPGSKYGMLPTLMSCMQREETSGLGETSSIRYAVTQVPMHLPMFRVNSRLLKLMFGKVLVSRREMHDMAVNWVEWRTSGELNHKMLEYEVPTIQLPLFYETFDVERHNYVGRLKQIEILQIMAVNKKPHSHPLRENFVPSTWYDLSIEDFAREYKPEELGGHTSIHPSVFLESLMMYKAKLRDLTQRKQTLKLVLMEDDSAVTNILDLILLGSFMSGARVMFTASPLHEHKRYVEDNVSHLMSIFSKRDWDKNWALHGTMKWDVLDDRLQVMHSKSLLSSFDLTNLMNATIGSSEILTFSDHRSKTEVWHTIFDAFYNKDFGRKLVVKPSDLMFNKTNNVYHMGSYHTLYSNALLNASNRVIGRETIQQTAAGTYHHWYFLHRNSEFQLPYDTQNDRHHVMDVIDLDYITVKLKNICGFLMLTTTNDFPISVICPAMPKIDNKVYVHCTNRLLNKDLIMKLGLDKFAKDKTDALTKILTSKVMLYHEDQDLVEQIGELEQLSKDDQNFADQEGAFDDETAQKCLDELFDLIGGAEPEDSSEEEVSSSEELEERTRWSEYTGSDIESEAEEEEAEYQEDVLEEGSFEHLRPQTQSSFLSQHGVYQSTSSMLSTRAIGGVRLFTGLRSKIKYAKRNEDTYEFSLPFDTIDVAYASGSTGTGLDTLVNEILNNKSVDTAWYLAYLRDCMVNDPMIMNSIKVIMQKPDEEEEEW